MGQLLFWLGGGEWEYFRDRERGIQWEIKAAQAHSFIGSTVFI